mgnify:CR=1 FL=1
MYAQDMADQSRVVNLEAKLVDKFTGEIISYANIFNSNGSRGTISDDSGYFKLNSLNISDSLTISFIGYKTIKEPVTIFEGLDFIYMETQIDILSDVILLSDYSFLYDLLASCKRNISSQSKTSKAYFELETYINEQQVEQVECYYNASIRGYDITDLKFKNGRIAVTDYNNRFFFSTATGEILHKHSLFKKNIGFPQGPLELSKNKLKKKYDLSLISNYADENEKEIYVVKFDPKDPSGNFFSGCIWINRNDGFIVKINLESLKSKVYPFVPLFEPERINGVNLFLTKTYQLNEGQMDLKSVNFDYDLIYNPDIKRGIDTVQTKSTKAIFVVYDYTRQFEIPYFDFTKEYLVHNDYRKISAVPYNSFFWEDMNVFKLSDRQGRIENFYNNSASLTHDKIFKSNKFSDKGFFEHQYTNWSEKRIFFRNHSSNPMDFEIYDGNIPSARYNLEAQIYLDINETIDSTHVLSETVFDPFKTFFWYPMDHKGLAFINMYFDIVEIQRRELEREIGQHKLSIDRIKELYVERKEKTEQMCQAYFRSVERGNNLKEMLKWNKYIKDELHIDNVEIFQLQSGDMSILLSK